MRQILYATAGLFAVLTAIGLALPRHTQVNVETSIDAHPATVFALLNDFRRVELWSTFFDADPNARISHSGPPRGVGATITWDGAILGTGTQVITASRPYQTVATTLNPGEPAEATTRFELAADGGATTVSWRFETDHGLNMAGRFVGLAFARVVRSEFEAGLANLKELAESLPAADFSDVEIEHLVVDALDIAYLPATSAPEPAAVSAAMGKAYFEILSFIDEYGLTEAGAPLSIARSFSGPQIRFDAAIPVRGVTDATPRQGNRVRIGKTFAGNVIRAKHLGSYRTLARTHARVAAYLAALGIERAGNHWESYVSDPTKVPEADLLTYIYYPVSST
jgi:effector-binding domain-containing protein/carbon monoxide dehydrogenase subunit G